MGASVCASNIGMRANRVRLQTYIRPRVAGHCLRALMDLAKNNLISCHALEAQSIHQVYVLAVRPVVPSFVYQLAQPYESERRPPMIVLGGHTGVAALVRATVGKDCPRSARDLVCHGNDDHIGRASF